MKNHNYLTVEKLEKLGNELSEIKTDLEIFRGYSEGFRDPMKLTKSEIYMSYLRAYKFFDLFFYKVQGLEDSLDDVAILLLEAGEYETLKEHLPMKDMNLPKIKG